MTECFSTQLEAGDSIFWSFGVWSRQEDVSIPNPQKSKKQRIWQKRVFNDFMGHKLCHWSPAETDWSHWWLQVLLSNIKQTIEECFQRAFDQSRRHLTKSPNIEKSPLLYSMGQIISKISKFSTRQSKYVWVSALPCVCLLSWCFWHLLQRRSLSDVSPSDTLTDWDVKTVISARLHQPPPPPPTNRHRHLLPPHQHPEKKNLQKPFKMLSKGIIACPGSSG